MRLKRPAFDIGYVIAAMLIVFAIQSVLTARQHIQSIPYSEFEQALAEGRISEVNIGADRITGSYKNPAKGSPEHFTTNRVEPGLADRLRAANVRFAGEPGPGLLERLMGWLLPTGGFILLWMFVIGRMGAAQQGGRAELIAEEPPPISVGRRATA